MNAITICQPYALLICLPETHPHHKRVENRKWHPPQSAIGQRIAIHAGKSRDWLGSWFPNEMPDPMPFSAIVGTAVLAASVTIMAIRRGDYAKRFPWLNDHDHAVGPICWVLEDVRPLSEPVPFKGAQGLWKIAESVNVENWH